MSVKIVICMGSSCFARGNEKNLKTIERFLEDNQLEAEVELAGSCCEGNCSEGPNIIIDGKTYRRMETGALIDILNNKFDIG